MFKTIVKTGPIKAKEPNMETSPVFALLFNANDNKIAKVDNNNWIINYFKSIVSINVNKALKFNTLSAVPIELAIKYPIEVGKNNTIIE